MIHFSLHTQYSYLSGASKIDEYVQHCKSNNITHLAITDYGTLTGILSLQKECKKEGIKPIFGCQVYMAKDMNKKDIPSDIREKIISECELGTADDVIKKYANENNYTLGEKDITSLNLWALDNVGRQNLYLLTSKAWIDGFYYKPRTDINNIIKYNEGLCVGTGDKNSFINRLVVSGSIIEATELITNLYSVFGSRLVVELPVQRNINNKAIVDYYMMVRDVIPNATYIPSSDVHFISKDDCYKHRVMSTIAKKYGQTNDVDINSQGLDSDDHYFHSDEEIIDRLEKLGISLHDSLLFINNTKTLAEKFIAEVEIKPFAMIMPKEIGTPDGKNDQEFLQELCEKSHVWDSIPEDSKELYLARTTKELNALKNQNFTKYVLYIRTILDMARDIDCEIGPGRGSAAGSIVNWHLKNTNVDPIKYNLLFERYIDPDRVDPPDNDIDVDPSKREELIQKMRDRWGYENVALINTLSVLKGKSAWNDVCRILGVPLELTRALSKQIKDDDEETKGDLLSHVFELDDFKNADAKYKNLKKYCIGIEGFFRQTGIHAAGVVCSDLPLYHYVPIETRQNGDVRVLVSAFDKDDINDTGILKVDLLNLDTVKVISQCVKEIRKTNPSFDLDKINFEDQTIVDLFSAKEFDGIFQYDSSASRRLCAGLNKFNSFIDISHITALNRPGPLDSGMAYEYIKHCNNNDHTATTYHEKVDHITKDTYGILVYQEQVMRVFADIQGHPKPDKMRKLIAKSKGVDEIEKYRSEFIAGSKEKHPDIPEEVLNKLFSDIVTFGNYAFNASHSVAYAKIAYIQQYLKHYYPLEFWYTLIKNAKDEKVRGYIYAAVKSGINFIEADVNLSVDILSYNKEKNVIIGGLLSIKSIGEKAAQEIAEKRPFSSFQDFYEKVNKRRVNVGVIKALVISGAMHEFVKHNKLFLENFDILVKEYNKSKPSFTNWDDKLNELIENNKEKDYPKWKKKEMILEINPSSIIDPFEDVLKNISSDIYISNINEIIPHEKTPSNTIYPDFLGYWVRGVVSKIYINYLYGKKNNDFGNDREKKLAMYGKPILYIILSTKEGEMRLSVLPDLVERANLDIEEGNTLLTFIKSPYKADRRARAVFNLSKLDENNPSHRSLFTKTHPSNLILDKLSNGDKAFAQVKVSKIYDYVKQDKLTGILSYGVIVGMAAEFFGTNEKVILSLMTMHGLFVVQYSCKNGRVCEDIINDFKIGDFVKCTVDITLFKGSYSFVLNSREAISKIKI